MKSNIAILNDVENINTISDPVLRMEKFRARMLAFEEQFIKSPDSYVGHEMDAEFCPLKHTFVDGAYVREIFMAKGTLIVSKIHKKKHPYFIMKGKYIVCTENGIETIEAPYQGITEAGTKRLLYIQEDCVWITVHVTNETDLEKIEKEIIAETFDEVNALECSETLKVNEEK